MAVAVFRVRIEMDFFAGKMVKKSRKGQRQGVTKQCQKVLPEQA